MHCMKLSPNESITIDGYLNESAWINVPFTNESFVDIAQRLYNASSTNGYDIPLNYSTNVKMRWDANYIYFGAILSEPFIYGSVVGHNNVSQGVPYFDHDFEVFIDPSQTNYFYKEFEINSKNATYDVLWHKTQPIPCNDSVYGNETLHKIWCQDTTYDNNGNWTMLNEFTNAIGLESATSIQAVSQNNTICDIPCSTCPSDSPSAWCPWTQLSQNGECNQWPHQLTKSWTIEMKMPFEHQYDENFNKIVHGGLLDTDDDALNAAFAQNYNPNMFDNLSEHVLFWSIDFGRTEHPLGYNEDTEWSTIKNESILSEVLSVYPTLLGIYPYNNYWEWTWQSVGITKVKKVF